MELATKLASDLKHTIKWGTYGKGGAEHCAGTCPEHQLQWKRLVDCDCSHLQAILRTQYQIRGTYVEEIIHSILKDRRVTPRTVFVRSGE